MSQSSFDIVSKIDAQEMKNAVVMAQKEMIGRFDFKGANCQIDLGPEKITLLASDEFKRKSMLDILYGKMVKRGLSVKCLELGPVDTAAKGMIRQELNLVQGIPMDKAKEMVKFVKDNKFKATVSIQADTLRVVSRSKDELQNIMALLRGHDFGITLQFTNYR